MTNPFNNSSISKKKPTCEDCGVGLRMDDFICCRDPYEEPNAEHPRRVNLCVKCYGIRKEGPPKEPEELKIPKSIRKKAKKRRNKRGKVVVPGEDYDIKFNEELGHYEVKECD